MNHSMRATLRTLNPSPKSEQQPATYASPIQRGRPRPHEKAPQAPQKAKPHKPKRSQDLPSFITGLGGVFPDPLGRGSLRLSPLRTPESREAQPPSSSSINYSPPLLLRTPSSGRRTRSLLHLTNPSRRAPVWPHATPRCALSVLRRSWRGFPPWQPRSGSGWSGSPTTGQTTSSPFMDTAGYLVTDLAMEGWSRMLHGFYFVQICR
jgi:hypothetical protein